MPNTNEVTITYKKLEIVDFRELKAVIAKEGQKYVVVAKITRANNTSTFKLTINAKITNAAALIRNKNKGKATQEKIGSINAIILNLNLLNNIIQDDTLNTSIYNTIKF